MERVPRPAGSLRSIGAAAVVISTLVSGCAEASPLFQGGLGSHQSEAFQLDGGSYLLGWTLSAQTAASCEIEVEILPAGAESPVGRATAESTSGGASQGAEPVADLAAGDYHLRVDSTCESWTAVVGEASGAPNG